MHFILAAVLGLVATVATASPMSANGAQGVQLQARGIPEEAHRLQARTGSGPSSPVAEASRARIDRASEEERQVNVPSDPDSNHESDSERSSDGTHESDSSYNSAASHESDRRVMDDKHGTESTELTDTSRSHRRKSSQDTHRSHGKKTVRTSASYNFGPDTDPVIVYNVKVARFREKIRKNREKHHNHSSRTNNMEHLRQNRPASLFTHNRPARLTMSSTRNLDRPLAALALPRYRENDMPATPASPGSQTSQTSQTSQLRSPTVHPLPGSPTEHGEHPL